MDQGIIMEFKILTIEDLKRDYSNRHGFVFVGNAPSNRDGCDKVNTSLKNGGYTTVDIEFVVELNPVTFIFVYPNGISFNSPDFYFKALGIGRRTGLWQLDTLTAFLQTH